LDALHSAKLALDEGHDYESTVKRAVQFGLDTGTITGIAGGIAGIRYQVIPQRWLDGLRGRNLVDPLLEQLAGWKQT
jgi:ADP-ribosylglycohydrolase